MKPGTVGVIPCKREVKLIRVGRVYCSVREVAGYVWCCRERMEQPSRTMKLWCDDYMELFELVACAVPPLNCE